ncbi:cell division protein ZapB [Chryseobacterium ginsenosidimutans]|uniref:cell division protein ZapB n=1 Tax=Chryseobacterium ginsenosidimutans TaxID=687846 RepID=UPI0031D02805
MFSALFVLSIGLLSAQLYIPTGTPSTSSNSNVGINTANPAGTLDINANGNIPIIRGNGGYIPSGLRFIDDSYTQAGEIKEWAIWKGKAWANGLGFMRYDAVNPCGTGICDVPLFLNDNGKVGIGIVSPESKLHVYQNPSPQTIDAMTIDIEAFSSAAQAASSNFFKVRNISTGDIPFIIKGNGNVGIGSANPDAKLAVRGLIHANEIKVDLNVPADYVFQKYYSGSSTLKPEYIMPTLDDVEKFTKDNNHLPNIPSAKEIQEKGLNVGEMSNLLLQKIEELTLYTIEQNKALKEQNEAIQEQNKIIKEQQKRIEKLENNTNK